MFERDFREFEAARENNKTAAINYVLHRESTDAAIAMDGHGAAPAYNFVLDERSEICSLKDGPRVQHGRKLPLHFTLTKPAFRPALLGPEGQCAYIRTTVGLFPELSPDDELVQTVSAPYSSVSSAEGTPSSSPSSQSVSYSCRSWAPHRRVQLTHDRGEAYNRVNALLRLPFCVAIECETKRTVVHRSPLHRRFKHISLNMTHAGVEPPVLQIETFDVM